MSKSWVDIQNEPVNEMKKLNLKLAASRRIRDDSGLTMLSVTGKQQSGKSSYAMLILYELYNGNVDEVLNHIVFSVDEFTKKIKAATEGGYRERCILWDDASVGGSASRWVVDPTTVMYLAALGDTLGIATKGLIMTSPSGDMIKAFRNYAKYKVLISNGRHEYDRIARGYWIGKSPMEQRWCSLEFKDSYDTRIPFYEPYAQKRKELSLSVLNSMDSFLNTEKEEIVKKPKTKGEIVNELHRDWEAGVYGKLTFKDLCKAHKINYASARAMID